jgi:hypothetical protein
MQQEHPIDTLNDDPDTWSHNWNYEQSDRFIAFEILKRTVLHETRVPLSSEDLYDKIGVSRTFVQRLIKSIQNRLNEQ